mmetsp:Transcript_40314/g.89532  ORF Transcript_40314/g.89532 Transcript_40314/m.89532 type:complete len:523 (-) Transcript_40314:138-1706(-)
MLGRKALPQSCASTRNERCSATSQQTFRRRGSKSIVCKAAEVAAETPNKLRPPCPTVPTKVAAVILGGGESDSRRLFPLTEKRTLPAIPLGCNYRLIDVPVSNCINSAITKIYILTQYNSTSLNRYLTRTYDFHTAGMSVSGDGSGFLEVVAATQSPSEQRWAEGAADSVRQWAAMLGTNERTFDDILVLPSDQLYRMNFANLVSLHRQNLSDLTIVCRPINEAKAEQFGVLKVDADGRVTDFMEKPKGDKKAAMSMDWDDISSFVALSPEGDKNLHGAIMGSDVDDFLQNKGSRGFIGSCGMYVFNKDALKRLLREYPKAKDFGRELIPYAIEKGYKVMAYNFQGFWEDIGGSITDFYDLHMSLLADSATFTFTSPDAPFFASPMNLPPSQHERSRCRSSMVGAGCTISRSEIVNSVIGSRSVIGEGCAIYDSIIMGADYYEHEKTFSRAVGPTFPPMGVGPFTVIRKAILDKNVRVGANCQLVNKEGVWESFDRVKSGICIRDGVIIISKSSVVPDGTVV